MGGLTFRRGMKAAASRTWSGNDSAYRELLDYASQNSRREQERSGSYPAALCSWTTFPRIPGPLRHLPRAEVLAVAPRGWIVFKACGSGANSVTPKCCQVYRTLLCTSVFSPANDAFRASFWSVMRLTLWILWTTNPGISCGVVLS